MAVCPEVFVCCCFWKNTSPVELYHHGHHGFKITREIRFEIKVLFWLKRGIETGIFKKAKQKNSLISLSGFQITFSAWEYNCSFGLLLFIIRHTMTCKSVTARWELGMTSADYLRVSLTIDVIWWYEDVSARRNLFNI